MSKNNSVAPEEQGGSQKETQKFQKNLKRLVALFNGEQLFKRAKIDSEELTGVIDELVKEEKDSLRTQFKTQAREIIKAKQEFDKFAKQKQKELEEAIAAKHKELNQKMDAAFQLVDKIETIEKSYYESLSGLSAEPAAPSTEGSPEAESAS